MSKRNTAVPEAVPGDAYVSSDHCFYKIMVIGVVGSIITYWNFQYCSIMTINLEPFAGKIRNIHKWPADDSNRWTKL